MSLRDFDRIERALASVDEAMRKDGPDVATTPGSAVQPWPQPADLKVELPPAPAFDAVALLPCQIADFVLDEADRMPCSPDYIAAALVVALGSVIGAR